MKAGWILVTAAAATLAACGAQPASEDGGASEAAAPVEPAPAEAATSEAAPVETATSAAATVAEAGARPAAFARCAVCHSTEPGKHSIGPSLAGIYGTKAGDVAGYTFSEAMRASGLTWDDATLDRYLANPRAVVPGTKMAFAGLSSEDERKAIIAYLKTI